MEQHLEDLQERFVKTANKIQIGNEYYIRASAVAVNLEKLVLKKNETFLVCDNRTDLPGRVSGEMGFYFEGTRFLNELDVRIAGEYPILLKSFANEDLMADLTNSDICQDGVVLIPRDSIIINRKVSVENALLVSEFTLKNFHIAPIRFSIEVSFGGDFMDIFEVRGAMRPSRGKLFPPEWQDGELFLSYQGLDNIDRTTSITLDPKPDEIEGREVRYWIELNPREEKKIRLTVKAKAEEEKKSFVLLMPSFKNTTHNNFDQWVQSGCSITSSNELFNKWINRSLRDIYILNTHTPWGLMPYAGIPWYVAPFGRDSCITALELLPFRPELAEGTLNFLAHYQGKTFNTFKDEQPGKILHELRRGEMANLQEIPFVPYYGTIDASPLFLILLYQYATWSGNLSKVKKWWPKALKTLDWIDQYGDIDGDGYLEYYKESPKGLINQGWKDSWDSVFHKNGGLAQAPIALAEVQGYTYMAKLGMSSLAELFSDFDLAKRLQNEAKKLKEKFHNDFWMEEEKFFGIATDKKKELCRIISSNPGHCLWAGLIDSKIAEQVAQRLFRDDMFSGWGIRTVAEKEARFNPMSYHNGSVWPHDNALILSGLKKYGLNSYVDKLATALSDVSTFFSDCRLPELFCGFRRTSTHGPTPYPTSCSPQAWSTGVVFEVLKAFIGLEGDAINNRVYFIRPQLPEWLNWIEITNLKISGKYLDFYVIRGPYTTTIEIQRKSEDLEVVIKG
ncbi:MAG: amylo-alpha-1,6-glucosidase [Candidatus Jettenia sp.]|uniref:Putative amylo-alpha-1,6-glucosidase n=1 Tax=Candidatus Jettenia caeni TaxID=247490 RepID=I3IPX7_9BACT|nr:amylo-alpha-1,6-glucosidase [Candidatus Jettenia sp. AMX1]MBC6928966.1 amylo-alpha-1,6-glucosidase [Candidatus Jettenia sp.]NUN23001.1 amylo-alpha-1,6-glucosidase [Candidatus Jettenia caeni]KAA0250366.1 MAG: amylo-alpha-1,6-glucosidase [Candidatus Jettenia sp. AMX1]MCE7880899.1 amylo-alpha-1,6-glucosidase [Candidatus Jettenia sp. AMX1]MCQ3926989.1 amylo-alpha-1,6-glucosidase [Candidatus Jettenia sp.]